MPYVFFNNNPKNARVGDCSVRAVSKAIGQSWQDAYIGLCAEGLAYKDMPSANYVWGMYLKKYGFEFYHAISGKKAKDAWRVINDVMNMMKVVQPHIYKAVIQRLKGI